MAEKEDPKDSKEGSPKPNPDAGNGAGQGPLLETAAKNGYPGGKLVPATRFFLFNNLETQGANLTYSWRGQIYTYEDNQVYEMTPEQAAHLNSLAVTLHTSELSPEGQIKSKPVSRRKRFSVTEVTLAEVARLKQEMAVNQ